MFKNINDQLFSSPKIICSSQGLEVHYLICRKDLIYFLWSIKSLQYYLGQPIDLFIHEDGTISSEEIQIIDQCIEGYHFIPRTQADSDIKSFLEPYPSCSAFRLSSQWFRYFAIKLFDFYYYSPKKRFLFTDPDVLFMKELTELKKLVDSNTGVFMTDVQDAYSQPEPRNLNQLRIKHGINFPNNFNSGLMYIPEDTYDLQVVEKCLQILESENYPIPAWTEQTAYGALVGNLPHRFNRLTSDYKVCIDNNIFDKAALHFVGSNRQSFNVALLSNKNLCGGIPTDSSFVYEDEVGFKNIKAILNLKAVDMVSHWLFSYNWAIADGMLLSHDFRINGNIRRFGSEAAGIFLEPKQQDLIVEHTYEYFGARDWRRLEPI